MNKKEQLISLGFVKTNENSFYYKFSKERKLVADLNVPGSLHDSIFIEQYQDVVFLCRFEEISVIKNLIEILK